VSSSKFLPQPIKSKAAIENLGGKNLMIVVDSNLEEEFPCKYNTNHPFRFSA
jgi:hypothetical protein